jgi:hypothetical protein
VRVRDAAGWVIASRTQARPAGSSRSTPAASSAPTGSPSLCCGPAATRAATGHTCPGVCVKTYLPAPIGDWGMAF